MRGLNLVSVPPLNTNSCLLGSPPLHEPLIPWNIDWFLSTSNVDILLTSKETELKSYVPSKKVTWSSVLSCSSKLVSSLLFAKNCNVSTPINLLADPKAVDATTSPWVIWDGVGPPTIGVPSEAVEFKPPDPEGSAPW